MNTLEQQQRDAVCAEVRSWLRTPYHHQARIKGVGVDCAMLLCEVYANAGLVPFIDPAPYPPDWWMHRGEERFLGWVEKHAHIVDTPQPGDMVVYKFGRCFSHGGVVVGWPNIVHAWFKSRMCELALGDAGELEDRERVFYSLWGAP